MIYTRLLNLIEALNDFPTFGLGLAPEDEFFKHFQPVKIKKYREQTPENQETMFYIRQY